MTYEDICNNYKRTNEQIAKEISMLEDSFCNPRKLKEAHELRQELLDRGLTKEEIRNMTGSDG